MSRTDPEYVPFAKEINEAEHNRQDNKALGNGLLNEAVKALDISDSDLKNTQIGSFVYANKPGDGSAREQAASCQKVLGGCANIAIEYATKRYRSNCINWGMIPFVTANKKNLELNRATASISKVSVKL